MSFDSYFQLDTDTIFKLRHLNRENCYRALQIINERLGQLSIGFDYLDLELFDLPLSLRAYNALAENGLKTVNDVLEFGLDRVWQLRNVGPKTDKEIKNMFKQLQETKNELKNLSPEQVKQVLVSND